jgi:phosphatidylglycerol:prolipoprotein diacylglycerol transferase
MLAIAFLAGILIALYRAKKGGIDPQRLVDLAVVLVVAAVVGGRLAFIVFHIADFQASPFEVFAIWRGGMTFYGGAILGFIASVIYLRRKKLNVWQVADIVTPSLALGLFLGRIGCFLNGCCFGKPTLMPWGILFPADSYACEVYAFGTRLHPTQIYSALAGLSMFLMLFWMEKWWRFNGSLFWRLVIMYSLWRIFEDMLRYQEPSSLIRMGGLTVTDSQFVSLGLIVISVVMLVLLSRRKPISKARSKSKATA